MSEHATDVDPAFVPVFKFQGLVQYCKVLEQQLHDLRQENLMLRYGQGGQVWYWQGDGEDHIESLTCPILIGAEDFKALLAQRGTG